MDEIVEFLEEEGYTISGQSEGYILTVQDLSELLQKFNKTLKT